MKKTPLLWLLRQVRARVPELTLLTLTQAGQALFFVLFALGTRAVIDAAQTGDAAAFAAAAWMQLGIIAAILISSAVLRHLRERLLAELDRDWKKKLLHGLLNGDYAAVSAYHSGELINRLNNDVAKVNSGILTIVPGAVSMVTRLVAAVVVLRTLDARFTGLVLAAGLAVILATALMRRKLKELNKQVSAGDGKVSSFLQEAMEKLLMVQAMDVSGEVERRADQLLAQRFELQRRRKNVSVLTNSAVHVMYYGAGFLALVWCGAKLLTGQMTFGSLMAVTQLVGQLQTPFIELSGVLPQYTAMIAAAERLMELESVQGVPAPITQEIQTLYADADAICARNVSFSYDRDEVLTDAGFVLPKGSFAVITGPSGMGKSTLLKLLLGVFRPASGGLYLRGASGELPLDRATRRLFAYVPQGSLLLSGTLRENLTIVRPKATREELETALHVSAVEEFLPQLPQGLDTPLGENGAGLSEGQIQRLAIARAVLGGAPVLLLDECTSALDEASERMVLTRLRSLPGRTCIAVTHRPAALELCDLRLKLTDGKIETE